MHLGTDPEFPIFNAKGQPVPAWEVFPNKEHKIVPVPGFGLFRDGFMLELNVPPSHCREGLAFNVLHALAMARKRLPSGYYLSTAPTVPVDLSLILQGAPADAMVFGCEPSWNAYTGEFESVPLDATEHPFRYAGGHMHMAWKKAYVDIGGVGEYAFGWVKDPKKVRRYVQLLDQYVGYPLSVWFAKPETFQRRKYYGQAGDFRFQTYDGNWYGVEYRTPGPEIWNSPIPASFAFGAARAVAKKFATLNAEFDHGLARDVRQATNEGVAAEDLLAKCYIKLDGSKSTKRQFLEVIAHERPDRELQTITIGGYSDQHTKGWDSLAERRAY